MGVELQSVAAAGGTGVAASSGKSGWLAKLNQIVAILTMVVSALTTMAGFVQKLALDQNPAASVEQVSEATDVMGYGVAGLLVAGAWYAASRLTPKLWEIGRAKFRASSLDPATKLRIQKSIVENCLEGLKGPFEGDIEAEDRIRWLAQRFEQKRIELQFPRSAVVVSAMPATVTAVPK